MSAPLMHPASDTVRDRRSGKARTKAAVASKGTPVAVECRTSNVMAHGFASVECHTVRVGFARRTNLQGFALDYTDAVSGCLCMLAPEDRVRVIPDVTADNVRAACVAAGTSTFDDLESVRDLLRPMRGAK